MLDWENHGKNNTFFNVNSDPIIVFIISATAAVVADVYLMLEVQFWPEMK